MSLTKKIEKLIERAGLDDDDVALLRRELESATAEERSEMVSALQDLADARAEAGKEKAEDDTVRDARVRAVLALGGCDPEGRTGYVTNPVTHPLKDPGDGRVRQRRLSTAQLGVILAGEHLRRSPKPVPAPAGAWFTYLGYKVPLGDGATSPSATKIVEFCPGSVEQLLLRVREAAEAGLSMHAVGAGHAASGVAVPRHRSVWLGDMTNLQLAGEPELPRDFAPTAYAASFTTPAARVPAGRPIWRAVRELWDLGLNLRNLGAYDEQALFGAMTTGTHGSGGHLGPIADDLLSIDLVTLDKDARVQLVRVERTAGPTDPTAFATQHPRMRLLQEDDLFRAVAVSFGQLGIAFAITVRVEPAFYLHERRSIVDWATAKAALVPDVYAAAAPADGSAPRFVQHLFDPVNGRLLAMTRKRIATTQKLQIRQPTNLTRLARSAGPTFAQTFMASRSQPALFRAALDFMRSTPDITVHSDGGADKDDEMVGRSWDVFYMGGGAWQTALATEVVVPVERVPGLLDALAAHVAAEQHKPKAQRRRLWMPFGVRHVRATDLWLSAAHRRGWDALDGAGGRIDLPADGIVTYIEMPIPMIGRRKTRDEAYALVDELRTLAIRHFGARIHGGKHHTLDEKGIRKAWSDAPVDAWKKARKRLDPTGFFTGASPIIP